MTFFFFTNPEAYGLASTNAGNFVYLESNGDRREGSAVSPAELRFGEWRRLGLHEWRREKEKNRVQQSSRAEEEEAESRRGRRNGRGSSLLFLFPLGLVTSSSSLFFCLRDDDDGESQSLTISESPSLHGHYLTHTTCHSVNHVTFSRICMRRSCHFTLHI